MVKKDDPAPAGPVSPGPGAPAAAPDAKLIAMHLTRSSSEGPEEAEMALGYFSLDGTSVPAGEVMVNGTEMMYFDAFGFYQAFGTDIGLTSGATTWTVSGENGFSAFTRDANGITFPVLMGLTGDDVVTIADGYTLTTNSVTGADSISFAVGDVTRVFAGNVTSYTFTAAELALVTEEDPQAIITASKFHSATYGAKVIGFERARALLKDVIVL